MNSSLKIFAPATIANLGSGFDLLGMAIDGIGDEIVLHKVENLGVTITKIVGYDLPYDVNKNIVGHVAQIMLRDANADFGVEIELYKGIKPGSGIGSSAASSAATVFGVNKLLGDIYDNTQMIEYAMEGELLVSGEKFADNVAPCLLGGMILINDYKPLSYLKLPVPKNLHAVVLHPQLEIKTSEARDILPKIVPMKDAIKQAKNLGSLIAGLYADDFSLISKGLDDRLATPYRSTLIPHFEALRNFGEANGVLGSGISGSGPSIFYICNGETEANTLSHEIEKYYRQTNIDFNIYISPVAKQGARILN